MIAPNRPASVAASASLLLLALILALAATLRTVQWRESLWLDELHTAWVVAGGAGDVCSRAAVGNQSPLYFFLVWGVTKIAGLSEPAVRFPSLVAGLLLVLLVYRVVIDWTGCRAAALTASLLAALDRNCVFYAQEARPYAWVQLVGLLHVSVFQRLVIAPRRSWRLAFVGIGAFLFYLHYTSALLFVAEAAYFATLHLYRRWRPAYRWRWYLLDLGLLSLCLTPALPQLIEIAGRRDNWAMFVRQVPFADIGKVFPLLIYLPAPLVVIGAVYLVSWLFRRSWLQDLPDLPRLAQCLLLSLCWLYVPLYVAWFATAGDVARLFFLRYLIVAAIAPIVFASLCIAGCPSKRLRPICATVLAAALSAMVVYQGGLIAQFRHDGRVIGDRSQDWRSAVAWINRQLATPNTLIFVRSGLVEAEQLRRSDDEQLREYCLLPVRGIYRLPSDDQALIPLPTFHSGKLSDASRERLLASGTAWFLLAGSPEGVAAIERELLSRLASSGTRATIDQRKSFGGVSALHLILASSDATRPSLSP
jgi:hypothetical protein